MKEAKNWEKLAFDLSPKKPETGEDNRKERIEFLSKQLFLLESLNQVKDEDSELRNVNKRSKKGRGRPRKFWGAKPGAQHARTSLQACLKQ